MADLWYYTSAGQRMEPVAAAELKKLAMSGTLKPTDMVWKEGMAAWVRAASIKGLFAGPSAAAVKPRAEDLVEVVEVVDAAEDIRDAVDQPRRGSAPARDEDDDRPRKRRLAEPNDHDGAPRRRSRPEREVGNVDEDRPARNKKPRHMSTGLKTALTLGGIAVGLAAFITIGIVSGVFGAPSGYSVSLDARRKDVRYFDFKGGVQYRITVTSDQNSDVDILIFPHDGKVPVAGDTSIGPNSLVNWTPGQSGRYRVEIQNVSDIRNRSHVKFEEVAGPVAKQEPQQPPADVMTKRDRLTPQDPKDERRGNAPFKGYFLQFEGGRECIITLESNQFDAYLRVEDDRGNVVAENDDAQPGVNRNARVTFRPARTAVYRIVVTSVGAGVGEYVLTIR